MSDALQVGSILEGKVVKIKPFGAIVSLGEGVQGLVHISQISESFVQDINDVVEIGEIVKVKVLTVDTENGKITLSMKAADAGNNQKQKQEEPPRRYNDDKNFKPSEMSFDDKLKDWIKQSNERQAGINKRNNRR